MAPARRRCSLRETRAPAVAVNFGRRKTPPYRWLTFIKKRKRERGGPQSSSSANRFSAAAMGTLRGECQECHDKSAVGPPSQGAAPSRGRCEQHYFSTYRIPVPLEYRLMFRHLFVSKLFRPLPSLTAARALNELAPFEPCLGSHVLAPGTLILDAFYPSYHPPCSLQPLFGSAVDHTACSDCSSAPPVRRSRQALCRASAVAVSLHAASGRYFN